MQKKTDGLLFRFGIIFIVFTVVTLLITGAVTYISQIKSYREQCGTNIKDIGQYLVDIITRDGENYTEFQKHFLEDYEMLQIPIDFSEYQTAKSVFYDLLQEEHPRGTFGVDFFYEDLSEEAKKLYLTYQYEYWTLLFEDARKAFDIPYSYYLVMDIKNQNVIYMIDGERTVASDHLDSDYPNAVVRDISPEEAASLDSYMYLCDEYHHDAGKYGLEWLTYETGKAQDGYLVWDNAWGYTYSYYTPLVIKGETLGLVGTEINVATVNQGILRNTLTLLTSIAVVLIIATSIVLWVIHQKYISKIVSIQQDVTTYANKKDVDIARKIEANAGGSDEIAVLASQTAAMILEINNYIQSISDMQFDLDATKQQALQANERAKKDALTGIRNRNAYEEEVRKLDWDIDSFTAPEFGIAMIDLNFLKKINDTYGHEKGNMAIIKLCQIVCRTFQHSPVFRIGGDEFVVILKGEDFNNRYRLTQMFKDRLQELADDKELPYWEQVSAAIGFAVYDKRTDRNVNNVFKRADQVMYEEKKRMKAVRE